MADPAEVGKYGTIRLLKRCDPSVVVAAYPIDDDEVSFGRDCGCSVRLYYTEVSPIHCKMVFEERKAFLQVLGASGAIIDGCPVYPVKSAIPGDPSMTVTVPLPNGSIFEIHKKRFMFNYPPKAIRPQLFTPATARRKGVRMSLVQSAQVFSPAPSPHPRENLRVLQSPLKLPSSTSPVKLVDTDHPRVYEEEQDLVILEDVEPRENGSSPTRLQTLPPVRPGPPQTPRRRSQPSLHRAVLIRSAQRTAYVRDYQEHVQDQQPDSSSQLGEINLHDNDAEEESSADEDEEDEVMNSILAEPTEVEENALNGRGSIDEMLVDVERNGNGVVPITEQDITEMQVKDEPDEYVSEDGRFTTPLQASRALHLDAFMTPQPGLFAKRPDKDKKDRRKTGPQRPPPGFQFLRGSVPDSTMTIKEEETDQEMGQPPLSPTKRPDISEKERKAIIERRRSALKIPDPEIGESVLKRAEHGLPPPIPPPTSPFKQLSTHIDEGADTQVVLRRMQAQVAERRASLSPTRPKITRDNSDSLLSSPTKTFSLLAAASPAKAKSPMREMPDFEEEMMKDTQNKPSKQDSMDVDGDAVGHASIVHNKNKDENVLLSTQQSQTPRLDGLREIFRNPSVAAGLATPAVRGIRNLFRAPQNVQTPRLDGMRQLFTEQRAKETPDFGGIDDMMHIDESNSMTQSAGANDSFAASRTSADVPEDVANVPETAEVQQSGATRKLPLATRILQCTKGARGAALIRSRGTPTDASTMADDEASPDTAPLDLPKRMQSQEGVPEAAVVHRGSRIRRGTAVNVSEASGNDMATKSPRRGRAMKTASQETEDGDTDKLPSVKPSSKSRSRRKIDPGAVVSDSETALLQPPKRAHGKRADSAPPEGGSAAAVVPPRRRTTRARSRSARPESGDAEVHAGRTTVETIPEEEEPVSAQKGTVRKASAPPTSRSRRTRTRTESSAEDAPPKKRTGTLKGSAAESSVDAASQIEDKENTPEASPVSESGDDSSTRPIKPVAKSRGAAKAAPGNKTKAGLGRSKTASKMPKAKTENEGSVPAPRTTRARARK